MLQLFQHPENVKISIFPITLPGRNAISSNVFNEFSKTIFLLKDEEGGYRGWNFKCTDILVLQEQRYNFSNIQKM